MAALRSDLVLAAMDDAEVSLAVLVVLKGSKPLLVRVETRVPQVDDQHDARGGRLIPHLSPPREAG